MSDDDVVIEYRGYWLIQRICLLTGTNRILRPDGTWRPSEPTLVGFKGINWIVRQKLANTAVEETETFETYDQARQWVDNRLAART